MNIQKIKKEFLFDLEDDYAGIWDLCMYAQEDYAGGPELSRSEVLGIVRDLLVQKQVIAGCARNDGTFEAWPGSADEIVARIDSEWTKLGSIPELGDIVWFSKN